MGLLDFLKKPEKKLIMLVEDDVPLRQFMADRLRENDIDVMEIGDGAKVVDLILDHQPDGVVLDIMLPGKSGMQILEELRHRGNTTPVLVLTTLSGEGGLRLEALKHNASFLNKADASPDTVIETILSKVVHGS